MAFLLYFLALINQTNQFTRELLSSQFSAVLWKDQLFVATSETGGFKLNRLDRGEFDPDRAGVRAPAEYRNPTAQWVGRQGKLQIRDNRLLLAAPFCGYSILPLTDVPLLEQSAFGEALLEKRGYPNSSFFLWEVSSVSERLLFPAHRKPDVPAPRIPLGPEYRRESLMQDRYESNYAATARFDIQIAGPKTIRLFHAYRDDLFVSVEPDYLNSWYIDPKTLDVAKKLPPLPNRQLRTGKLPPDFTEHFAAYTAGGRDYLVTNTGKAYTVTPKGKTGVEVTAVWTDARRPLLGVVQDLANDAVYGYGLAGRVGAAERFFVKFDAKPVAKSYKLTVPVWEGDSNAFLEAYECARAFRGPAKK